MGMLHNEEADALIKSAVAEMATVMETKYQAGIAPLNAAGEKAVVLEYEVEIYGSESWATAK